LRHEGNRKLFLVFPVFFKGLYVLNIKIQIKNCVLRLNMDVFKYSTEQREEKSERGNGASPPIPLLEPIIRFVTSI
jgi:hypothetical protein